MNGEKLLDNVGRQILRALQENGRVSFSELGRMVGLSSPAVTERVRRMEESGYIKGYKTIVNQEKLGFPITVFVDVEVNAGKINEANEIIGQIPEITEAYRLSGDYGFMLKVVIASMEHLESVIGRVGEFGTPTTSMVLSTPVSSRPLDRYAGHSATE
ncbi:MAG: Lrp/AsnC family transcriptional regulator [Synergistaceae bacterium]|jgi:Lrp/AsnC family leucine-responsive transcriptional regulator|nr:Lrp/AsnC family transcriptional regulator [Synergistaceae bacterium]